jgi:hypothetical protein
MESVYGRIKMIWRLLRNVIPSNLLPHLKSILRIIAAVLNAFFPPLRKPTEFDSTDLQVFQRGRTDLVNAVQVLVNSNTFKAKDKIKIDQNNFSLVLNALPGDLSKKNIRIWNGGPYGLRLAPHYLDQINGDLKFSKFNIKNDSPIFQVKGFISRFKTGKKRLVYLQFFANTFSTRTFCLCKAGARTIGGCCHIIAALYYS